MGELISIAGKKNCTGTEGANTGKKGCTIELSTPEHLIKMPKSFKMAGTVDFNLAYVTEQIQKGVFIPILGASSFEETSSEDAYNTNSSGEKRLNVPGLPEYKLTFEEGHEFYRQLSKVRGYKDSAFLVIDDQGNIAIAKDSKGNFKGFKAGHVTPEMRKSKVKGGDNEMKSLLVQFIDRKEWDENYEIILNEELDFNPSDIPAVNGVDIELDVVPASGDTEVKLSMVLSSDKVTEVEGLEITDLKVQVDGVDVAGATIVEDTPGKYTLTLPALSASNVLTIDLYDSTVVSNIILVEDVLLRSETLSTVIA